VKIDQFPIIHNIEASGILTALIHPNEKYSLSNKYGYKLLKV
jgi:hypothetical protein